MYITYTFPPIQKFVPLVKTKANKNLFSMYQFKLALPFRHSEAVFVLPQCRL